MWWMTAQSERPNHLVHQPGINSSLQTLISYLLPSPLYVLRYSSLLFCAISSLASFVFGGSCPYWFIGFRVFLEFVDEIVKVLLFLLPVL